MGALFQVPFRAAFFREKAKKSPFSLLKSAARLCYTMEKYHPIRHSLPRQEKGDAHV